MGQGVAQAGLGRGWNVIFRFGFGIFILFGSETGKSLGFGDVSRGFGYPGFQHFGETEGVVGGVGAGAQVGGGSGTLG